MNKITIHNLSGNNLYYHSLLYIIDMEFGTGDVISRKKNHKSGYFFLSDDIPCDKEIVIIDGCNFSRSIEYIKECSNENLSDTIIISCKSIADIFFSCIELKDCGVLWLDIDCTKGELIHSLCNSVNVSETQNDKLTTLTRLELETIKYILCGYSNRSTAISLRKGEKTISYIKKNAMRKLNIKRFSLLLTTISLAELKMFFDYTLKF